MEWAIGELRSNDERNMKIATEIAKKHGIQVRFVAAEWGKLPVPERKLRVAKRGLGERL